MALRPLLPALFLAATLLPANDGAAAISAGGLVPRNEPRVVPARENLHISPRLVKVEYEFFNESTRDVTTEVAFPIPEYALGSEFIYHPFDRFSVKVNGRPCPFRTEIKAWAGGRDLTDLLTSTGIDIATFARIQYDPNTTVFPSQIRRLAAPVRDRLKEAGAIDADGIPRWSVRKTYHWTQRFPARTTVHITHRYIPVPGATVGTTLAQLEGASKDSAYLPGLEPACLDSDTQAWLKARLAVRPAKEKEFMGDHFAAHWIRYILTTANTWKTPIGDFQMEVAGNPGDRVSFCWNGPKTVLAPHRVRVRARGYRPEGELTVYFLPDPAGPAANASHGVGMGPRRN
jgi:hypothetical protein